MDTIFQVLLIVGVASLTVALLMKLAIRYLDVELERLRERERARKPTKPGT